MMFLIVIDMFQNFVYFNDDSVSLFQKFFDFFCFLQFCYRVIYYKKSIRHRIERHYYDVIFFLFWIVRFCDRKHDESVLEIWCVFDKAREDWCMMMRFELQNFWHDVCLFRRFEFFDRYCCLKLLYNFSTNLWSCLSRFHIEFVRSQVNNFFLDIVSFTALKALLLILFFLRISTLWTSLHKCDEANRFFRCFLEFDDEFDDEFIARFRLNDTNVVQYLIDFDNWYVEEKSTKIFSLFLLVVKLKSLTNNQVVSYFDLEIVSFDDFFDFFMIFVRIIFDLEFYRILFHSFTFDHVADNNSKHQIIIEYYVWERKIDFFEDVFFFSTDASIFLVLCCFWFIFWDSDFSAMRHW
jgi:hypothetical protein